MIPFGRFTTWDFVKALAAITLFNCCGCLGDGLFVPEPLPACCVERDGQLVCRDNSCPELVSALECTTLANASPTYCQVPLTDDCQAVYLERTGSSSGRPFQTVYCF